MNNLKKNEEQIRVTLIYFDDRKILHMRLIIFLLFTTTLFSACGIKEREQALQKKETELAQREQEILLQQRELELKEEELLKKERIIDSTRSDSTISDSTMIRDSVNSAMLGVWAVKMTCTETTCPGSAVGDVKNEHWEITIENNQIVARALAGENLVRVYSGVSSGNSIELTEHKDSVVSEAAIRMTVRLRMTSDKAMEGQREIIREGDCKIVYALQLEKKSSII
jgi:hypothetical protein